jgi:hypothetical protein
VLESPTPAQRASAYLILVACAFSAGIHFALVPGHAEDAPRLGLAFALAGALLIAVAIAVHVRPRSATAALLAALLLTALIAAYLLSRATALPGAGHGAEPFDLVGVLTKVVELAALAASVHLHLANRSWPRPLPKTRSTT